MRRPGGRLPLFGRHLPAPAAALPGRRILLCARNRDQRWNGKNGNKTMTSRHGCSPP
jgi:hypothetical protein